MINAKWDQFFRGRVELSPDGCFLWSKFRDKHGYGMTHRGPRTLGEAFTHRVSWRLAFGDIPAGLFVCHQCDARACCNPDHLFLGDAYDNMRDMTRKGRNRYPDHTGAKNPNSKFDDDQVWAIKEMVRLRAFTKHQVAAEFGVTPDTIGKMLRGETWKHVRPGEPYAW